MKAQQATNTFVKETFMDLKTQLEITTKSHQASIQNLKAKFDKLADKKYARPSGSLPSSTQPNLRGNSSKLYQPPHARNEHVNAIFTQSGKSYDPPTNPSNLQNDSETPINFDSEDEDKESTPQPKSQTPKPNERKISIPTAPIVINENMLVEVGKFIFLVDFVILEMEEDSKVPLILGRPFLHTDDEVIRVKQKQLNLGILKEYFDALLAMTADENSEEESVEEPPTDLELKPLPDNLEYVFLEEPSFLPVIISSQLLEHNKNTALARFDIEIKEKKGTKNVAADHLSRIENDKTSDDNEVDDNFPEETLMVISTRDIPWSHKIRSGKLWRLIKDNSLAAISFYASRSTVFL
ncbi:reverse transcriptase domain-containing protein [Tanacetum coccineum]